MKAFVGKKPKSTYRLTEVGITNFREYVEMLEDMLKGIP